MSHRSLIRNGEFIASGQCLVSANGRFFACVDEKGNLYLRLGSTAGFAYWQAAGSQGAGNYAVLLQDDGNICSYAYTPGQPITGSAMWCTWTQPGTDQYFLIMQDDGNLCQYRGTGPADNRGLAWAAGATFVENGPYRLYSGTTYENPIHVPAFVAAAHEPILPVAQSSAKDGPEVMIKPEPVVVLANEGDDKTQLWQKLDLYLHGTLSAFALRNLHYGRYLSGRDGYANNVRLVRAPDKWSFWTPGGSEDILHYHALRPYADDKLNLCVTGKDTDEEVIYEVNDPVVLGHWVSWETPANLRWLIKP